ncbi:MAG: B12-binding domain-containing radical SAM protein [Clostridiales bacterium]|jgi:radical SAM superfamily enzyme YgiQ (UPF0313 family)|nr:B12-binding domain-containing radical SAM protein [Clostridiales bacterium]
MDFLLVSLNAKYIHSCLALYSLKSYINDENANIIIKEYTINNTIESIVADIYRTKIKIVCFSLYIWNIEQSLDVINMLKKAAPEISIIAGGPEADGVIGSPNIDIAVLGEGEITFSRLVSYFLYGQLSLQSIKGASYKQGGQVFINEGADAVALDDIPFVYKSLLGFEDRIIYYEASRGCPFNCQYCLSSAMPGVRYLSLGRVFSDLSFFLDNTVKQVKFVDRTFNSNPDLAYKIWGFLIENDNGHTNFHFEVAADLLTEKQLCLLKKARKGLFQFEAGVQSTNKETLEAIKRKTDLNKLFDNVRKLKSYGNIHQHLDLIAGLPYENFASFKKSFNDVAALRPGQLQLGFLKVLKGAGIIGSGFEIVYNEKAPYEVIFTKWLSYDDILALKMIEEAVELFYNSNRFENSLNYIIKFFDTPFDFFYQLGQYWLNNSFNLKKHNKLFMNTALFEFGETVSGLDMGLFKDLIKFDILLNENIKSFPDLFLNPLGREEKAAASKLKRIHGQCNIEKFEYNVLGSYEKLASYILFTYGGENIAFDITAQFVSMVGN